MNDFIIKLIAILLITLFVVVPLVICLERASRVKEEALFSLFSSMGAIECFILENNTNLILDFFNQYYLAKNTFNKIKVVKILHVNHVGETLEYQVASLDEVCDLLNQILKINIPSNIYHKIVVNLKSNP